MNSKSIRIMSFFLLLSIFLSSFPLLLAVTPENEWTTRKNMPTEREGFGVAVVNGKVYAIGGSNDDGVLAVNEVYDPSTDTWENRKSMPTARSGFAIAVFQSKIYVFGGTTGNPDSLGLTGVTEVYDPSADKWEAKSPMPTPRSDLCANVVDGIIFLMGGKENWIASPALYHELGTNEIYNVSTNTWTVGSPIPVPVFGYASAVIDEKIFIIGGARQLFAEWNNLTVVNNNQVYDAHNDTWSNGANLPVARSYAAATATTGITAPKSIYVIGGFNQGEYSNEVYAFDLETNTWKTGSPMPTARGNLGLATVEDLVFAIGGSDGEIELNTNEEYSPFEYGTVPPVLQVLSPEEIVYSKNKISLILTVNKPTSWIGYSLDGDENITISGDTMLSNLSEGEHILVVYANDTFGNIGSSKEKHFIIDTLLPSISITSPENKTYAESDIHSIIVVDEPVSWIGYSLDDKENVTISTNITIAALGEGSHKITFYATDLIGNTGNSNTIYFNIAPYPIFWVAGIGVTLTIAIAATYLILKRKMIFGSKKPT